jgi:hypothetical protein
MRETEKQAEINSTAAAGKEKPRRPYKKPRLAIYGKLAELTAGNTGSKSDPGQGTPTRRGGP